MRKGLILFLLSFFVFQYVYAQEPVGLSAEVGSSAETQIADPNEWDFGQVKSGAILKHDFILKNETNDVIKINKIHSSCGCTASEAVKKSLLPGESTVIKVTFNSKGYSGPVRQFVYVNTDNVVISIVKFTIKALVVKEG